MDNNFIQMPDASEVREELAAARADIQEAIKESPELADQSKFVMEVLATVDEMVAPGKDLNKLNRKEQISFLAHMNLFYSILEDIFFDEDDLMFDDEDLDEADLEEEEK